MSYPILIFGMLVMGCTALQAQDLSKIRETYKAVNENIALCNENLDEPCGYYVNTLTFNRQSQPWPAVGILTSIQDFWYHSDDAEEGQKYQLRKVNIKTSRSNRTESEEYLWNTEGELIFYFFKMASPDDALGQEFRFYFADGKLLDYSEKISDAEKDYAQWKRSDAAAVQASGKKLHELFIRTL